MRVMKVGGEHGKGEREGWSLLVKLHLPRKGLV